jgi:hypothetical protein
MLGDWKAGKKENPWQVIPTAWVVVAMERWRKESKPDVKLSALGVDVARGGDDHSVIAKRYGNWFDELKSYAGSDTPNGPALASRVLSELRDDAAINVDVIGVGSSVYDYLRGMDVRVNGINFAEHTDKRDRSGKFKFMNVRAAAYWALREALDPDFGDGLMLPDDAELKADLCAPNWELRPSGILVESKQDIISRIGRSPDKGDAVALANWIGSMGTGVYL